MIKIIIMCLITFTLFACSSQTEQTDNITSVSQQSSQEASSETLPSATSDIAAEPTEGTRHKLQADNIKVFFLEEYSFLELYRTVSDDAEVIVLAMGFVGFDVDILPPHHEGRAIYSLDLNSLDVQISINGTQDGETLAFLYDTNTQAIVLAERNDVSLEEYPEENLKTLGKYLYEIIIENQDILENSWTA